MNAAERAVLDQAVKLLDSGDVKGARKLILTAVVKDEALDGGAPVDGGLPPDPGDVGEARRARLAREVFGVTSASLIAEGHHPSWVARFFQIQNATERAVYLDAGRGAMRARRAAPAPRTDTRGPTARALYPRTP